MQVKTRPEFRKTEFITPRVIPSPPVLVPTIVANSVFLTKYAKPSAAENTSSSTRRKIFP